MNKGNVYDVYIKYPSSIGATVFKNMKLIGDVLGPDMIRQTIDPNIDTVWFNIGNEASVDDYVKDLNINDLIFYIFTDIENNKIALAKEWIYDYRDSGNDFRFEVKDITIEQKMVIIKNLKSLGITVTEI